MGYYNKVQKRWHHKKLFFWISVFWIPCIGGLWWKTSTAQISWESVHGARDMIWPHEHLISPIEIKFKFTLISMGLIRYSCGHISDHHEPIHVKFGVWGFFIMFYWSMVTRMLKCKKGNLMTSHFSTLWNSEGTEKGLCVWVGVCKRTPDVSIFTKEVNCLL